MNKNIIIGATLALGISLTACKSEPVQVKVKTPFKMSGESVTITKFESFKYLRSPKKENKLMRFAPEGKQYVHLQVELGNKDAFLFTKAFVGEKELKSVSFPRLGLSDPLGKTKDYFYLVNDNTPINKVQLKSVGSDLWLLNNPKVEKAKQIAVPNQINEVIKKYTKTKAIGRVNGFNGFVADGKSALSISTQNGKFPDNNVLCNHAELTYFSEDGKVCEVTLKDILGGSQVLTTHWENGKVTKIIIREL